MASLFLVSLPQSHFDELVLARLVSVPTNVHHVDVKREPTSAPLAHCDAVARAIARVVGDTMEAAGEKVQKKTPKKPPKKAERSHRARYGVRQKGRRRSRNPTC